MTTRVQNLWDDLIWWVLDRLDAYANRRAQRQADKVKDERTQAQLERLAELSTSEDGLDWEALRDQ